MKCIIIDDEPIARRGMCRLVERHPDLEICSVASSAEEALTYLQKDEIDLMFLDIQMPGMSGIELANTLRGEVMVIFTTAYSEYAVEGFDVNAIDYLVKPIDPLRFDKAVAKAREYISMVKSASPEVESPIISDKYLIVRANRRYMRIQLADIKFIEGLKDYVVIHTKTEKIVTRMTIKGIEELLPTKMFLRVNKSYIANVDSIDSFDSNDIYIGELEIAIGNLYKDNVFKTILG